MPEQDRPLAKAAERLTRQAAGEPVTVRSISSTRSRNSKGQFARRDEGAEPIPREPEHPKTGLRALRAQVRIHGLKALDGRLSATRSLFDWRRNLIADFGGEAEISAAQRALIETVTRTKLYLDHVDSFLLQRSSLVNARGRVIPLVGQRQQLAESLVKTLVALGLERRVKTLDIAQALVRSGHDEKGLRQP